MTSLTPFRKHRALNIPFFNDWDILDDFVGLCRNEPLSQKYDGEKVDIKDYDDKIEFVLDAPGYNKDDITIKVQDDILSISGEIKRETEEKNTKYLHKEISNKSFVRRFDLGRNTFKSDKITAEEKDGFYVITAPKLNDKEKYTEIKIK